MVIEDVQIRAAIGYRAARAHDLGLQLLVLTRGLLSAGQAGPSATEAQPSHSAATDMVRGCVHLPSVCLLFLGFCPNFGRLV